MEPSRYHLSIHFHAIFACGAFVHRRILSQRTNISHTILHFCFDFAHQPMYRWHLFRAKSSWPPSFLSASTIGKLLTSFKVTFNISLYAQVRDIDGNSFQDWVLTYVFLGEPFGSLASGILIQRTGAVKGVLAGSMCLSIILYIGLGVGWISKFSAAQKFNHSYAVIEPELAVFAPILILFGVGSGASMSSLAIALFGTVPKHGV